jgi:hypothetical protein
VLFLLLVLELSNVLHFPLISVHLFLSLPFYCIAALISFFVPFFTGSCSSLSLPFFSVFEFRTETSYPSSCLSNVYYRTPVPFRVAFAFLLLGDMFCDFSQFDVFVRVRLFAVVYTARIARSQEGNITFTALQPAVGLRTNL